MSDATREADAGILSDQQLMDAVLTCGTYRIGSIMTTSLGIQLEEGLPIAAEHLPLIESMNPSGEDVQ